MNSYVQFSITMLTSLCISLFLFFRRRRAKKHAQQFPLFEEDLKSYFQEDFLQHEEKVRKGWLSSFYACYGVLIFILLFSIPISLVQEKNLSLLFGFGVALLVIGVFILPGICFTYYYAYKKRGTSWLTFNLVGLVIPVLSNLVEGTRDLIEGDKFVFVFAICFDSLICYFLIHCYRLRKVNAFRKRQTKLAWKRKYGDGNLTPSGLKIEMDVMTSGQSVQ